MTATLRFFFLLALITWLGGLLFFGAVLAPVAFTVLPTNHLAGLVVGASLRHLHVIGLVCGAILLITQLMLGPQGRKRAFTAALVLIVVMLALTSVSQFAIIPAMDQHRAAALTGFSSDAELKTVPEDNAELAAFNRLHNISTWVEQGVIFCAVVLTALAALPPRRIPA
jgi:uncharacterized membrane protein